MQHINDLTIRAYVAMRSFAERAKEEQEGQTAVEYAGILALIATIFALLFLLNLDTTIRDAVRDAVNTITGSGGGGGEGN